jgi:hypothetical protein
MLMDFNHLFIKGIGPVMYRLGKKNPAANYTQNNSVKEMVFLLLLIVGFHFIVKWLMKLMEIHQDMGERFKIRLTMRLN